MADAMIQAIEGADFEGEVKSRLIDFLGTPTELRGNVQTLDEFAEHEGVTVGLVSKLLRSDAGVKQALRSVALAGLFRVPRTLQMLAEAAEGGSLRAAEIQLDFIRKTLTDQQLMASMRPEESFEEMVSQAVSGAQMLLEKAKGRKVTVGVSIEEGVSAGDSFRARGELAVREGMPMKALEGSASVEEAVLDVRVPEGANAGEVVAQAPKTTLQLWEERNSSGGGLASDDG